MNPPHWLPRRLPRVLSAGLITVALTASVHGVAAAQCAPIPDLVNAVESADSVFVGRVRAISTDGRIASLEVLAVWKGRDLPVTVEVRGAASEAAPPSATDRRFEVDRTYLVIPENSRVPFLATGCSATQPYTGSGDVIPQAYHDAAGATEPRIPAPAAAPSGEAAMARSILPMLGAIVLIGGVWLLIRRLRTYLPQRLVAEKSQEKPAADRRRPRRLRRRSLERDLAVAKTTGGNKLKRHRRRFRGYRRRQNRQLVSSRKARGSTDTS